MAEWHHQCNGHELREIWGDGEGQGSLECYSPWGEKESDTTGGLNNKNHQQGMLTAGEAVNGRGQGTYGNSPHLPLNFSVNLKQLYNLNHNKKSIAKSRCGLPGGTKVGKELTCQCRRHKRCGLGPGKIPWRRAWQPPPVFLPGESHGQRSLAGYSPWGCKELDTT